ncbi:MAG: Ger(x)C family spore germination C-terminal domain-containing protein [Bacillota bacterium]
MGKIFSEVYPDEWKKMEPQWDETFQNMEIKVEVGANLWRVGEVSQTTVQ